MKKIILIDDNTNKVKDIFSRISKMLWKGRDEEGIASRIIFFGDQFKARKEDTSLQDKNINDVAREIKQMLMRHSRDVEQWDTEGNLYQKKKALIENLAEKVDLTAEPELKALVEKWRNVDNVSKDVSTEMPKCTSLAEYILAKEDENNRDDIYILLDVILLFDDIKQIESDKPIISMELYHAFKEKGYKCYLYSSYAFDYLLMEKYKGIYQKVYGECIEAYHSNDFFSENEASDKCLFYYLKE